MLTTRFRRRAVAMAAGAAGTCALLAVGVLTAPGAQASPAAAGAGHGAARHVLRTNAPTGGPVAGRVTGAATVTSANRAAVDRFRSERGLGAAAHRGTAGAVSPAASQYHRWWGTQTDLNGSSGLTGLIATQTADPSLRLNDGNDFLYAPTTKPSSNACIEMVTVHTSTGAQLWAWDWCTTDPSSEVGASVDIDSGFMSRYGTTAGGRQAYTVELRQTDAQSNTWTAYLYNYSSGAWDTFFTSGGQDQSGVGYGWDMFEYYSDWTGSDVSVCGDLSGRTVSSSGIQLQNGGSWSAAGTGNAGVFPSAGMDPSSYMCPGISGDMVTPYSNWQVTVS